MEPRGGADHERCEDRTPRRDGIDDGFAAATLASLAAAAAHARSTTTRPSTGSETIDNIEGQPAIAEGSARVVVVDSEADRRRLASAR